MRTASLAGYQPEHLVSLEEAEAVLAPYRERLERCIQHGWNVWKSDYSHKHHILTARSRAAIVFDEIAARALEEFPEGPDLKVRRSASSFMLYIGDSIILRFKKIKKNGWCSNILTRQQILFRSQVQLTLPTMQKGTLVHAGYLLDDLQQEILQKSVVCQLNNSVIWRMELSSEAVATVEIMPTPTPQTPPSTPTPRYEPKPELVPEIPAAKVSGEEK